MTVGMKKRQAIRLGLAAAILLAPLAHAEENGRTQIAAAIGAEDKPAVVAPATPPPAAPPQTAQASSPTSADAPDESEGFTSAEIWLGVGAAAFLAAVGGGGGGGGGSTTQH